MFSFKKSTILNRLNVSGNGLKQQIVVISMKKAQENRNYTCRFFFALSELFYIKILKNSRASHEINCSNKWSLILPYLSFLLDKLEPHYRFV